MLKKGILFFLGVCFLISQTNAQTGANKLLFYHIGEKDGLTSNAVMCFYQDYRGVMWIGTENGLNSFDGSEINTWKVESGTTNYFLTGNLIYFITGDADHNIWVATENGLRCINLDTKKVRTWLAPDGDNRMRSLAIDGNHIWIATGGGVLLFDIGTKIFKRIYIDADVKGSTTARMDNDCNYVYRDSKNRIWLGTVNGLWQYDRAVKTFTQKMSAKNDPNFDGMVNTIYEDHYHKIWVGCWAKGLKQVIPETDSIKNYNNVPLMPSHIMNIAEQKLNDGQYKLWLSGYLTSFDQASSKFERNELRPIAEAAPLEPRNLFVSRDNLLWVATVKGVYILDPARQLFRQHFLTNSANITNQNPSLFFYDNKLLVGGDEDFALKQFDSNYNLVKAYNQAIKGLKGEYANLDVAILNITSYQKDELLLSTSAGVLKLNKPTGKITVVCHSVGDDKYKPIGFINNVFVNKDRIWAFPWRKGVWQYDDRLSKFTPLVVKLPDGKALKNLNLQDAIADSVGNVWITDLDYGLVKYTSATRQFRRIIDTIFTPYCRSVQLVLVKNKLWLTANQAVVEMDPYTGRDHSWPMPPNMSSSIYSNTADNDGNLLLATRVGLVIFNTLNHSFSKYTEDDGLINNDLDGALYKLPSGEVLYAGENYITSFKPGELLRTPAHKTLMLTAVIAGDTDVMVNNPQKIEIPPGTEKLTFKWALLNYTNPLQNRYYYKLDKIDNDWNYAGKQGKGEYNHLPPGTYRLRYRAVTSDGLAGGENVLVFKVLPWFWQTWWFKILLVMLLIAGVLLIIRNVREKERKKAALQVQLSGLEMKALRAQMNPHFIFNALNSIQECIITKNTNTAYSYLSSFSKLVRMILENSEKQFISLEDEIETLRLYLSIEKLRFDDTFEYKISIAPGIDTTFVRLPAMIIQPFVENALWHGLIHKKGDKKLILSFNQEGNKLVCVVKDNGVGRDHAAEVQLNRQIKKQSMGMKITEERLQLLETDASILINDLKDKDANPCGTQVTIMIPLAF